MPTWIFNSICVFKNKIPDGGGKNAFRSSLICLLCKESRVRPWPVMPAGNKVT